MLDDDIYQKQNERKNAIDKYWFSLFTFPYTVQITDV